MATRRANGEGTLQYREDRNLYESTIMVGKHPDGRKKTKTFTGKTKTEVLRKVQDYLLQNQPFMLNATEYSFSEWADLWYENHMDNIKPTTQESYRYTLQLLKDHFGNRMIREIKTYDIEQYLKKLRREGRSDSYLAKCRAMLFQIFKKAVANDLAMKNPVADADKMRSRGTKRKESFTTDEVKILLEELPDNKIGWSIRLLLCSGMRTQELLALEPRHIAADGSYIDIEQAINMVKGTAVVGDTKSQASIRRTPLPTLVQPYALLLRSTSDRYIWESPKKPGTPCNPSHFRDQYQKTLEKIPSVRSLSPHSCRHTYVSMLQALGVDLPTIQSCVGHVDVAMTLHYLHVQDSIQQAAVEKFSVAFSKQDKPAL